MSVNVTIQKRQNKLGQVLYRAIIFIRDVAVDSWGKTPEEAVEKLKIRMGTMAMKLDEKFKKEVKKALESAPKSEANKIVHDNL